MINKKKMFCLIKVLLLHNFFNIGPILLIKFFYQNAWHVIFFQKPKTILILLFQLVVPVFALMCDTFSYSGLSPVLRRALVPESINQSINQVLGLANFRDRESVTCRRVTHPSTDRARRCLTSERSRASQPHR